jgi:alpha-L-fucosidase
MLAQFKPGAPPPELFQPWESCMTVSQGWSYNKDDHNLKSGPDIIRALIEIVSRGGNLLLNVGPGPDGTIDPALQRPLTAIGDWLAVNGEAIYGTTYGPLQPLPQAPPKQDGVPQWAPPPASFKGYRTTAKGNNVYVHLMEPMSGEIRLAPLPQHVLHATALADGRPITVAQDPSGIGLALPRPMGQVLPEIVKLTVA